MLIKYLFFKKWKLNMCSLSTTYKTKKGSLVILYIIMIIMKDFLEKKIKKKE